MTITISVTSVLIGVGVVLSLMHGIVMHYRYVKEINQKGYYYSDGDLLVHFLFSIICTLTLRLLCLPFGALWSVLILISSGKIKSNECLHHFWDWYEPPSPRTEAYYTEWY